MFHVEYRMTPEEFAATFDVPRGTLDRLSIHAAMLTERQAIMNLVGPATLDLLWERHMADSAQLAHHVPTGRTWLDIGAGGGFPGLVLAAMEHGRMILVESIRKKARFLEEARDAMGLAGDRVQVVNDRIEMLKALNVDVATARATAPLRTLLDWAIGHVRPEGMFLFPKGRRWLDEVSEAKREFAFKLEPLPSITDPDARILKLWDVQRRRRG